MKHEAASCTVGVPRESPAHRRLELLAKMSFTTSASLGSPNCRPALAGSATGTPRAPLFLAPVFSPPKAATCNSGASPLSPAPVGSVPNCEMRDGQKIPASCKRCDDRHRRRMSWMWWHNPHRLCTLYSLVAFQLTRKGLPVTTAPLAVEIPLIAS